MAQEGGLHQVQTGSGRLAGKVAIVTGTHQTHTPSPPLNPSPYLLQSCPQTNKAPPLTGAASGFGLATTNLFVAEGCKVVAADLNGDALAKHFSSSDIAHHVASVTGSVTDAATWAKLVATAKEKFGGLDIVVNNAGTSYKNKPTAEVTEADFDKCFNVNVKSVFHSIPAAVPALEERGGGAIINVASIGASRPRPGLVWYNASKGAVANVSVAPLFFPSKKSPSSFSGVSSAGP
jgi:NADP-dependent 3-hydroxy acid dehydrogenase YdfG